MAPGSPIEHRDGIGSLLRRGERHTTGARTLATETFDPCGLSGLRRAALRIKEHEASSFFLQTEEEVVRGGGNSSRLLLSLNAEDGPRARGQGVQKNI